MCGYLHVTYVYLSTCVCDTNAPRYIQTHIIRINKASCIYTHIPLYLGYHYSSTCIQEVATPFSCGWAVHVYTCTHTLLLESTSVFCPHWSAVVIPDHHSAVPDQYSVLPDHHSSTGISSLSSYCTELCFVHPMAHRMHGAR